MSLVDDDLLDYYQRELVYLRKAGVDFARSYPKVAGRLELGPNESADPNVERLIEAFAFLTGRIQRNLESEFPEVTQALLGLLYPQMTQPVPAMAIARLDADPDTAQLTTGHVVPRHTALSAEGSEDVRCRFRTAQDVTLWPITVERARIESTDQFDFLDTGDVAAVLRLTLRSQGVMFNALEVRSLRFFLDADPVLASSLFELIFSQVSRVGFQWADARPRVDLAERVLSPVGFDEAEAVLPYPRHAHPAYRLLQEYFSFPQKFHFFDVALPKVEAETDRLDVLLMLRYMPKERLFIDRTTFALGCVPVINLFPKMVEPIRRHHRMTEYRLVPDYRNERTAEIHSLLSVTGVSETGERSGEYLPFFSFNHDREGGGGDAYWLQRRVPTGRKDLPGTDMFMAFVDLKFKPTRPPDETIFVTALCTNRTLTEQVPAGAELQTEQAAPLARITLLNKPTAPRPPPLGGETAWRLISHLSLNYLSLAEGADSLKALREILRLYAPPRDAAADQQIQGLSAMECRRVVRRLRDRFGGFARGVEVALEFDERRFVGGSAFLMAMVLNRFLGLYTTVNSFTQLKITSKQRSGVWKVWAPLSGDQHVL
jgi:type VI secretion system protein ImpG